MTLVSFNPSALGSRISTPNRDHTNEFLILPNNFTILSSQQSCKRMAVVMASCSYVSTAVRHSVAVVNSRPLTSSRARVSQSKKAGKQQLSSSLFASGHLRKAVRAGASSRVSVSAVLPAGRLILAAADVLTLPEALLFDCDGVLVDTERDGHRISFNIAFSEVRRLPSAQCSEFGFAKAQSAEE
jgi:hypothetical protein